MTKIIGLTGGIATGKSTVAAILRENHLPIVDADEIAKQVEASGTPTFKEIVAQFGSKVVLPDGNLDRLALGKLVFHDAKQLSKLNTITQLPIQYAIFQALVTAGQQAPMVILDVPLLFEGGWQHVCDVSVVVSTSLDQQLQRLQARNQLSKRDAQARINSQLALATKRQLADHVIDNSGTIEETKVAVLQWLATLQ